jgi:phosphoglycerate dehydrogenase-like enzyme
VGIDDNLKEYSRVIKEADYVVNILPYVEGQTEKFISMQSTFSKMKKSAVFINIGRGKTVNEQDLV